jgi:hypothetical protein
VSGCSVFEAIDPRVVGTSLGGLHTKRDRSALSQIRIAKWSFHSMSTVRCTGRSTRLIDSPSVA